MTDPGRGVLSTLTGSGSRFASSLLASAISFVTAKGVDTKIRPRLQQTAAPERSRTSPPRRSKGGGCIHVVASGVNEGDDGCCACETNRVTAGARVYSRQFMLQVFRFMEQHGYVLPPKATSVAPAPPRHRPPFCFSVGASLYAPAAIKLTSPPRIGVAGPIPPFPCSEEALLTYAGTPSASAAHCRPLKPPLFIGRAEGTFTDFHAPYKDSPTFSCSSSALGSVSLSAAISAGSSVTSAGMHAHSRGRTQLCLGDAPPARAKDSFCTQMEAVRGRGAGGGLLLTGEERIREEHYAGKGLDNAAFRDIRDGAGPYKLDNRRPDLSNTAEGKASNGGRPARGIPGEWAAADDGGAGGERQVPGATRQSEAPLLTATVSLPPSPARNNVKTFVRKLGGLPKDGGRRPTSAELIEELMGDHTHSVDRDKYANMEARATLHRALRTRQLDVARSVYDSLKSDKVPIFAVNYVLLVQIALSQKEANLASAWLLEFLTLHGTADAAWLDRVLAATAVATTPAAFRELLLQLRHPEVYRRLGERAKAVVVNAAIYPQTVSKLKAESAMPASGSWRVDEVGRQPPHDTHLHQTRLQQQQQQQKDLQNQQQQQNQLQQQDQLQQQNKLQQQVQQQQHQQPWKCAGVQGDAQGKTHHHAGMLPRPSEGGRAGEVPVPVYEPRRRRPLSLQEQAMVVEEALRRKEGADGAAKEAGATHFIRSPASSPDSSRSSRGAQQRQQQQQAQHEGAVSAPSCVSFARLQAKSADEDDASAQQRQAAVEAALESVFEGLMSRRAALQQQHEVLTQLTLAEKAAAESAMNPHAPEFVPGVAGGARLAPRAGNKELANLQRRLALQKRTQKLLEEQLQVEEKVQEQQVKLTQAMMARRRRMERGQIAGLQAREQQVGSREQWLKKAQGEGLQEQQHQQPQQIQKKQQSQQQNQQQQPNQQQNQQHQRQQGGGSSLSANCGKTLTWRMVDSSGAEGGRSSWASAPAAVHKEYQTVSSVNHSSVARGAARLKDHMLLASGFPGSEEVAPLAQCAGCKEAENRLAKEGGGAQQRLAVAHAESEESEDIAKQSCLKQGVV